MKSKELTVKIEIPDGVTCVVNDNSITMKGKNDELVRKFNFLNILISQEEKTVIINAQNPSQVDKANIFTTKAHINNMIKGVQEPFSYRLKICSGHFPMSVSVNKKEFSVKNFLGEKIPRNITLKDNVTVKLDGQEITINSSDIELAGQTAASIEQLCRITNKDRRIYQDGIWITKKAHGDILL